MVMASLLFRYAETVVVLPDRIPIPLLEVSVTPLGSDSTARIIAESARASRGLVVGNLNLHGVYVYHTDPDFARYCAEADLVLIDGAPVAWAGGLSTQLRIGSTDWLDALMPIADGLDVLAIGGSPEASRGAEQHFRERFPAVKWTGVDGYSSQEPNDDLRAQIIDADIVLVGMGMPKQEQWILRNRALLKGKVVANVGGCFDYYAGVQKLAPRWLGRLGLEWLYRLAANPARLAERYIVEPIRLTLVLAKVKQVKARATDQGRFPRIRR